MLVFYSKWPKLASFLIKSRQSYHVIFTFSADFQRTNRFVVQLFKKQRFYYQNSFLVWRDPCRITMSTDSSAAPYRYIAKPQTPWFVCLIEGQPCYGVKSRSVSLASTYKVVKKAVWIIKCRYLFHFLTTF